MQPSRERPEVALQAPGQDVPPRLRGDGERDHEVPPGERRGHAPEACAESQIDAWSTGEGMDGILQVASKRPLATAAARG